jgi:Zn-dependent peptidase ImmA (M78 family)
MEPFSRRARPWERKALELRALLRLRPADILDPFALAPLVGLTLMNLMDVPIDAELKHYLMNGAGDHWSAGVYGLPLPDGTYLCVLNPTHDIKRRRITLMEEISHVFLRHAPTAVRQLGGGLAARGYDHGQEQEAYGVGAAALLPWEAFFRDLNAAFSIEMLAQKYGVSTALVAYRISIVGATNLHTARQASQRRAGR